MKKSFTVIYCVVWIAFILWLIMKLVDGLDLDPFYYIALMAAGASIWDSVQIIWQTIR